MPLYEYRCPAHHVTENLSSSLEKAPASLPCPECGEAAGRIVSVPNFYFPWAPAQMTGKEMLAGTPLEDDDGRDHPGYKSDRIQVEVGR